MIWRIRDRVVFDRFRRDGRRARVGSLWMTVIADPQAVPPRVAYAVGRSVGSAPVRNRVRRRLRSLVRARAHELTPGWYLIGADALQNLVLHIHHKVGSLNIKKIRTVT